MLNNKQIKNKQLPLVVKSIALRNIKNMYNITDQSLIDQIVIKRNKKKHKQLDMFIPYDLIQQPIMPSISLSALPVSRYPTTPEMLEDLEQFGKQLEANGWNRLQS